MKARLVGLLLVVGFLLLGSESQANPYVAKPGEKSVTLRIATCAVSGGLNVIYRLIDLDLPFIYSSLHASNKILRERAELVQRIVADFAESVHFVEKNSDRAKASLAKAMKVKDQQALQVSYDVYARDIIDRRMLIPERAVAEAVELARQGGTKVQKKPEEIYDQSFVSDLEKSGFLKELWGSELN